MFATLGEMLQQGTIIMIIMVAFIVSAIAKQAKANPEKSKEVGKAAASGAWNLLKRFMK